MASGCVAITTLGSLGDLHPYLAIGQELQRRGHRVRLATLEVFRERVGAAGLAFYPLRATTVDKPSPEMMRQVFHPRSGFAYLLRELILPALPRAFQDTEAVAYGADLLIGHPLTFATPLVAETRHMRWISTQLAPMGMLSAYDPPMLPGIALWRRLGLGPRWFRALFSLAGRVTRRWLRPVDRLRRELGLPAGPHPLFSGSHSPIAELALFSRLLAAPQPDWPQRVTVTGFPFFSPTAEPTPDLDAWMDAGPPPLVFTLGSSAVMLPGRFFEESMAAARLLGRRALLLGYSPGGRTDLSRTLATLAPGGLVGDDPALFAAPYASYTRVFPRAAAVVHQGGIGTTAEALRAGRPMLVVPHGVDQPDNAARVQRLGVAAVLPPRRYSATRVAAALHRLLQAPAAERAGYVAAEVGREQGAVCAAEAVEAVLAGT